MLKRFDILAREEYGDPVLDIRASHEGEWVRYEDVVETLRSLLLPPEAARKCPGCQAPLVWSIGRDIATAQCCDTNFLVEMAR